MLNPVHIGPIAITDPVFLAPMSGVTDLAFRRLVSGFGAGMVTSEMVASREMFENPKKSMVRVSNDETLKPLSVQLVGRDPEWMVKAAKYNQDLGADILDINMGCPAKKVTTGACGSALMKDLDLATRILEQVVRAVEIPVTVKMRLGWDSDCLNAPELASRAENVGIKMIAVHGRTRQQFYKGQADWREIRAVKNVVSIPVIANGDIISNDNVDQALSESGADGVMIGRGAYGRPWFPAQVIHYLRTSEALPDPDLKTQRDCVLDHYSMLLELYGEHVGSRVARKHIGWYLEPHVGGTELRNELVRSESPKEVLHRLSEFYNRIIDNELAP